MRQPKPEDCAGEVWKPHIAASLDALKNENKTTERSFGIIQPDAGNEKRPHLALKGQTPAERLLEMRIHTPVAVGNLA